MRVQLRSAYIPRMTTTVTYTGTAMPRSFPKPRVAPNCVGMPYTGTPPVMNSARPKPMEAMASVIMKGDTLRIAMPKPLAMPMLVPAPSPARMPRVIASPTAFGSPATTEDIAFAETTLVMARMTPTERSNPPVSRASICAMETIVRYVAWRATLKMFCPDTNRGSATPKPTTRMASRSGRTPRWTKVTRARRRSLAPRATRISSVPTPTSATGRPRAGVEAVRQHRLLRDLGALQLGAHRAPVHDIGPVGEVEDLREVGGDQQDAGAFLLDQILHEGVHLGLGADVDPRRRLIHDEQSGVPRQSLRDHHLLLVAAREEGGAALDPRWHDLEPFREPRADPALAPPLEEDASAELWERQSRERDVLAHVPLEDQPLGPPVRWKVHETCFEHLPGCGPRHRPAPEAAAAGVHRLDPEARPAHLRLAGADQPGEADDLSGAYRERHVPHQASRAEPLDRQQFLAGMVVDPREERLDPAAGHQLHQLLAGRLRHLERGDAAAVPEHGDPVPDPVDFVHAMGDVDDPRALTPALPDELEQPVGFALGQRGGGLIEDQDRHVRAERLGDLEHLLLRAR